MTPITSTLPGRGSAIPHGRTARRLEWALLPATTRALVERRLGSAVVGADSAGAGYTPGLASVLTCADGSRHFVKAASKKAQRPFADAYREEIRLLHALPEGVPVPRLLWSHEDDLWVVLELEYVDATLPTRPWRTTELDLALDALELLADRLSPSPLRLPSLADELAGCLTAWDHVRRVDPGRPGLDEAALLTTRAPRAVTGTTLVHTDVRDDNLLLADGRALLCGWTAPATGAAWVDTVTLLIAAHGDGLDAEALLRRSTLTRDVPDDDVDSFLALMAGFFLARRDQPVPNSSPYLRVHQSWYAEASWSWLSARRGWG